MRLTKLSATLLLMVSMMWLAIAQEERVTTQPTEAAKATEAEVETAVEIKEIPFKTIYELSRDVGAGRTVRGKAGVNGKIIRTFEVSKTGKRTLIKTDREEPQNEVIKIGRAGFRTSRGSFKREEVRTMTATAYHPYDGISRKGPPLTKMGIVATFGCIAVDPRVIPLGTWLYVEGYGIGYACDTGGAIKGNKIDVCLLDRKAIYNWGRRKVKVHILSTK